MLNGWRREIGTRHERYWAHAKTFPPSILPPLSFRYIWHTACRTVMGGAPEDSALRRADDARWFDDFSKSSPSAGSLIVSKKRGS